jgi:ferrous iron transport protein A
MAIKLTNLQVGKKARVLKIDGGMNAKNKLRAMGILPGVDITVVQIIDRGPVVIKNGNTRLAIGRGMAEKVVVDVNG